MARALLIVNPAASRTTRAVVGGVERVFKTAGWNVDTRATTGHGDARRLAEAGLRDGVDRILVLGGDGTIMQAASALVGTDVPLGVLPGGTGNQLIGNLRLSYNAVRAARALVHGQPKPFDLGRIERADGVHYFAVAGGGGLDARVMEATKAAHKRTWGTLAYFAATWRLMAESMCVPFRVEADGVVHEFDAATVMVMNCGELVPPLFKLGQGITPYDGVFDVLILKVESFSSGVRAVWDVVRESRGVFGETVYATRVSGSHVEISTPGGPQPVQLDGEPTGTTPFTATVIPSAIRLIHPEG